MHIFFCLDPIYKNLDYSLVILFHCIDAEMASQSEDASAAPSAQIIGNSFVELYYKVLHGEPEEAYRFYKDSSVLTRPGPDGVMTSFTTVEVSFVKYKRNCLIVVLTRLVDTTYCHKCICTTLHVRVVVCRCLSY